MFARVCVQTFNNGDIQGFLYIYNDVNEIEVASTNRFASGSKEASAFKINGSRDGITVRAVVDVDARTTDFSIDFSTPMGPTTTSQYSQPLLINSTPC